MGIWNTHQYAGNIVGLSVASAYSDEESHQVTKTYQIQTKNIIFQDWTLSFMFPSLIVACVGFLVFMFLVPKPSHVGLTFDNEVCRGMFLKLVKINYTI